METTLTFYKVNKKKKEKTLLEKVSSGDKSAVRKCLETYGDLVWNLISNSFNSNIKAEKITLEVFQEIWKTCRFFDSELVDEKTFILSIAERKILEDNVHTNVYA